MHLMKNLDLLCGNFPINNTKSKTDFKEDNFYFIL